MRSAMRASSPASARSMSVRSMNAGPQPATIALP
jgi:hypothetical protein